MLESVLSDRHASHCGEFHHLRLCVGERKELSFFHKLRGFHVGRMQIEVCFKNQEFVDLGQMMFVVEFLFSQENWFDVIERFYCFSLSFFNFEVDRNSDLDQGHWT